jgi:pilus assembly protein CpaB
LNALIGNVAMVPIKKGEQISYNKIADPSMRTGLAPQIAPGRRAIALPVDEKSGVSKLIKPGDRVDLITVLDFGGGKENKIAKTILQDVVVLSIGHYITNNVARVIEGDPYGGKEKVRPLAEDFGYATVTLEVDPVQAQVLALILNSSDNAFTLVLRNNEDNERSNFGGSILTEVLGPDAAKVRIGQAGKK